MELTMKVKEVTPKMIHFRQKVLGLRNLRIKQPTDALPVTYEKMPISCMT